MNAPLVSIGLPVYNGARFLSQALDSLLGQTLPDLELIISDNASTDHTADICLAYAARDARIRYIRQKSNIGATRNWNFVAQKARGAYFKWASANDFCDPRMLEKCVNVLSDDPRTVLCHGRTFVLDEDTGKGMLYAGDVSATHDRPSERFHAVARSLVLNNEVSGLMRLNVLQRTPLMRPYVAGDLVLTIELSLYGCIVLLPDILYYRRVGPGTCSMHLTPTELQLFLHARSTVWSGFAQSRRRMDLLRAVLRAPIHPSEKLRTLLLAAPKVSKHLLLELLPGAIQREQHPKG